MADLDALIHYEQLKFDIAHIQRNIQEQKLRKLKIQKEAQEIDGMVRSMEATLKQNEERLSQMEVSLNAR